MPVPRASPTALALLREHLPEADAARAVAAPLDVGDRGIGPGLLLRTVLAEHVVRGLEDGVLDPVEVHLPREVCVDALLVAPEPDDQRELAVEAFRDATHLLPRNRVAERDVEVDAVVDDGLDHCSLHNSSSRSNWNKLILTLKYDNCKL